MFNKPLLGGFDVKAASAYLLPPIVKPKKKKKLQPEEEVPEPLDKEASALAESIVFEKQAELRRRIESGDLGGGWNPHDQLNSVQ